MTNTEEQYIVRCLYNKYWGTVHVVLTYDKAVKLVNDSKSYDRKHGREYKYRIIKQIIQEEVVYDEQG